MKTENVIFKRIYLFVTILIFMGILKPAAAQIPAAMEKDMDNINAAIYEALKVIDSKNEAEALKQLVIMKPKIEAQVMAFAARWDGEELSDEEEIAFGKKMIEKQLYKDMYALMAKPSFMSKIENSSSLKKEYEILMSYLDEEEEENGEITDSSTIFGSSVLTFTISGPVPYAGNYSVKGNKEQAVARMDDNNLFAVEITSTLNGGEFQFVILSEEAKTGEQKWSMESQIIIQSWDKEQNEVIQMSTYYNEGSITFDKIEKQGGKVTGSFKGKFFDDTQATDRPVNVTGSFSVTRK
ncbi:MAG TPA: hypothetical protein VLA03_10935 [Draconibacterium sp.]|nr:hypothetical protein [Draconibacterium sp.]